MSNIYIQEPPTHGKILMKTSLGEIDIELWSKEAPLACRNFVQLCMEDYYNETIFHRVIKGFIAQGGDPTGTGTGGESVYGKPFKDEFHQRLKFNRRGLVAMANAGKDDNGSQFFFTLDRAEELQKKHTIFGKVTGNTIYNMIRFNDLQIEQDDRPSFPPKIIKTEILSNPFDDIESRKKKKSRNENEKSATKIKSKSKATKNYKLLSFGEEAEEDEEEEDNFVKDIKIKSSHDAAIDPKLISRPALDENDMKRKSEMEDQSATESIRKKLKKQEEENKQKIESEDEEEEQQKKKEERRKALQEEARKLKKELKSKNVKMPDKGDEEEPEKPEKQPVNDLMKELLAEKKLFRTKKKEDRMLKKGSDRESQTLALLAGFETRLHSMFEKDDEEEIVNDADDDDDDVKKDKENTEEDRDWMTHKLQFEESSESGAKDANMKGDDWYDIYDPRNPMNKRRREKKKEEGESSRSSKR